MLVNIISKNFLVGGIAQLVEHLLCKQGVRSSSLLISTKAFGEGACSSVG